MCLYMYIVFTVSQFHADVHSVYLVFLFDTTILSESMSMSNMFWWDHKESESTEPFNFTLHIVYLLVRFLHVRSIVFIAMVKFFLCISFDLQKERTKERKKEQFFSNRELLSTRNHWTINPSLAQDIIGITGTWHLYLSNSKYPHLSGNLAQKIHCIQ